MMYGIYYNKQQNTVIILQFTEKVSSVNRIKD